MKLIILIALLYKISSSTSDNNEELFFNSRQLISMYKYPSEHHYVETEDGYILKLFRIPRKGPPILLAHGIGDSSDSWLVLGPKKSLAFILADYGFDVWLYNSRGNKYSKKHVKRLPGKEYWRFSFDEMGTRDLPATIDYILAATREFNLSYIGFSQGCTIFLVMCSSRPEYNNKIKHSVLLAPVAWIHKTKYPFINFIVDLIRPWSYLTEQMGMYEMFSSNHIRNTYHSRVCSSTTSPNTLCALEYLLSYGLNNVSHVDEDKFAVVSSHIPAGVSSFTLLHFVQNYVTKRFQKFDYEIATYWKSNQQYLRELPEYNVSDISVPITMFASATDWFSDEEDVNRLRRKLRTVANYIFINEVPEFSHIEFIYGSRVNDLVNGPLIEILLSLYNLKR